MLESAKSFFVGTFDRHINLNFRELKQFKGHAL